MKTLTYFSLKLNISSNFMNVNRSGSNWYYSLLISFLVGIEKDVIYLINIENSKRKFPGKKEEK